MKSFLEPLNLAPYRALLKEQGFDDPDDFGNMSASDVDTMAAALSAGGMKPGHVLKLSRTINELRKPAGEPSTPPAVSAGSAAPSAQSLTAAAAALLGAATSASATGAHAAKVETWRASCGGNLLFGRSNPTLVLTPYQKEVRSHTGTALTRPTSDSVGALSHHHHHHPRDRAQMNKAADKMLSEQPSTHARLVSFRGSSVQLQPLIEACKVLVAGEYDFAKKKGSRAGGLAGAAGYRGGPSGGPPINDDSSPAHSNNAPGKRTAVAGNLKLLRLAQIPRLLEANATEYALQVSRRDDAAKRNQIAEALAASDRLRDLSTEERALQDEQLSLQRSMGKAKYDKSRADSTQAVLGAGESPLSVPKVTPEALGPEVSAAELELVQSLERQLQFTEPFSREATSHGRLRVSPLGGLQLDEYAYAESVMCRLRGHEPRAGCPCSFRIQCATQLKKVSGGRMMLSDLWNAVSDAKKPNAQVAAAHARPRHHHLATARTQPCL